MRKLLSILLVVMLVLGLTTVAFAEDTLYIPVLSKGFQHQFWQVVAKGAQQAADDYGAEIYFYGPPSETDISLQVEALKTEMTKNPKAIALAALSTDAVMAELTECVEKGIPVIGFDSGVPNAPEGAIYATASTNNQNAAALAADEIFKLDAFQAKLGADGQIVVAVLSQDAVSESVTGRTTGFVNEMKKLCEEKFPGQVSIEGHDLWAAPVENAKVVINVQISATTNVTDVTNAANTILNMDNLAAVFCSNEGAVTGFLAATSDGSDLAEGGRYAGVLVAGFDAGAAQKNAVRNGWLVGSITQDPYMIGYKAVELAVKAAKGEEVSDVDTGAKWYTAANIDDPDIAQLVYD